MEETNQDPVGTETKTSGKVEADQSNDTVAYETYRKVLSEKKSRDERLGQMEARLKEYEQRDLESKGKYEELLSNLREENKSLRDEVGKRDRAYIMSKVHSAIKTKALEEGCRNPDKLMRLIDEERIRSLEVDQNYNVSLKDVEMLVNEAKRDNDFLFKRDRPNVADGTPVDKPVVQGAKPISKMSNEELAEAYKATYR